MLSILLVSKHYLYKAEACLLGFVPKCSLKPFELKPHLSQLKGRVARVAMQFNCGTGFWVWQGVTCAFRRTVMSYDRGGLHQKELS